MTNRRSSDPPGSGVEGALADLRSGRLDDCQAACLQVLRARSEAGHSDDAETATGALATVAYLHGDFMRASALGDATIVRSITAGTMVPPPAVAATAFAHLALGHRDRAFDAIGSGKAGAAGAPDQLLETLFLMLDERQTSDSTADRSPTDPRRVVHVAAWESDLAVGAAAARLLSTGPGPDDATKGHLGRPATAMAVAELSLLRAAVAEGARMSASLPVSLERAIAVGLCRAGDHDEAAAVLAAAEGFWRGRHAYTEVAKILLRLAELNALRGDRETAKRQASEAYALTERLGMHHDKATALALHHATTPAGWELGASNERVVLMSDVVGSTRVSTTHGDEAYYELVMAHHDTVRALLDNNGGTEFSEGGDSLLAWFESPEDALDCALEILQATKGAATSTADLNVRVSLAGGEPFFRDGRPYGSVVNRAARLIRRAEPGQLVVDEPTLTRMSPVVRGFTSYTIDLDEFGPEAIGVLAP
jgi:class 3 adenylate cyclase